jgi:hypothetical protein
METVQKKVLKDFSYTEMEKKKKIEVLHGLLKEKDLRSGHIILESSIMYSATTILYDYGHESNYVFHPIFSVIYICCKLL